MRACLCWLLLCVYVGGWVRVCLCVLFDWLCVRVLVCVCVCVCVRVFGAVVCGVRVCGSGCVLCVLCGVCGVCWYVSGCVVLHCDVLCCVMLCCVVLCGVVLCRVVM